MAEPAEAWRSRPPRWLCVWVQPKRSRFPNVVFGSLERQAASSPLLALSLPFAHFTPPGGGRRGPGEVGRCPGKQGGAWFPEIKLEAASSHGRFPSGSCCLNGEDSLALPESGSTWPRLWEAASGQTATVIPQAVGLPQGSIWGGGLDGHCVFLASRSWL